MDSDLISGVQNIRTVQSVQTEGDELLISTEPEIDEREFLEELCHLLNERLGSKDIGIEVPEKNEYVVEKGVTGSNQEQFSKYAAYYGGVLGMDIGGITMVMGYPYDGNTPRIDSAAHLYNVGVNPMSDTTLEQISEATGVDEVTIAERYGEIEPSNRL